MYNILEILKSNELFSQIEDNNILSAVKCLGTVRKKYAKNEVVLLEGGEITFIAIVISGSVLITKNSIDGSCLIVTEVAVGGMFGEALACAGIKTSPFTIVSKSESEVMFIDIKKLLNKCSSSCDFHSKLIENLLRNVARKNVYLNNRIDIISKKTLREKLLAYFETEMTNFNSNQFKISFSRDELANYLCVNRSAMSRELSNMRDEGLIAFNKNNFIIKSKEKRC